MKQNCLTRALDQWDDNRDYKILYNGHHVVCVEKDYTISSIGRRDETYLLLKFYGIGNLFESFNLAPKYKRLLTEYLKIE